MSMSQSAVLAAFVGPMKVETFARLAGLGVERLVSLLLEPEARGALVLGAEPAPSVELCAGPTLPAPAKPPELARMIDRASYREIHVAVDRWYVVSVMNEERGNVSRVARRLRISRRRVRLLWAGLCASAGEPTLRGEPSDAPPPPAIAPLLAKGTYRQLHDTVDRWLLAHTVTRVGGNVSHAARDLAISRMSLRNRLARLELAVADEPDGDEHERYAVISTPPWG